MEPFEEAREVALRFIDYAPRTSTEVRRRLARSGYDEDLVEAVVSDLEGCGILDDAQLSQAWVEGRAQRKGLGRTRLAAELRRKGIDRELVEEAVGGIDPEEELQTALRLAEQKTSAEELAADPAAKRRLVGFLQRRGYNWELIEQVIARILANNE